jgi:hypothetical protein
VKAFLHFRGKAAFDFDDPPPFSGNVQHAIDFARWAKRRLFFSPARNSAGLWLSCRYAPL